MGTNYYAVKTTPTVSDPIHIGKSSYGWLFLFQEQDEPYHEPPVVWHNIEEVRQWLYRHTVEIGDYAIVDEDDEMIQFGDFMNMVESKQRDPRCNRNPDNFYYSKNVDGYRFTEGSFS